MNKLRITFHFVLLLSAAALLVACGGGFESDDDKADTTMPVTSGLLQSLTITPATSSAVACSTVQFNATGHYSDNTSADVTNGVYWEIDAASSGVAIANTMNGQVAGIKPGSATVNAWTGQGIAASAILNVTGGSLDAIAITPAISSLPLAGSIGYVATATCSNNSSFDISRMNIWASSSPAVATISASGFATAVTTGSTAITATAGTVAASAVLNVP